MTNLLDKKTFMTTYMATYMAGMYVKRSDEHLYTGHHPYSHAEDVPVEDAHFMAEVAWLACQQQLNRSTIHTGRKLARTPKCRNGKRGRTENATDGSPKP